MTDARRLQSRRFAFFAEAGVTLAMIGLLAGLALPRLIEERDRARSLTCDATWVALRGEVADDLDSVLSGGETRCGTTTGNGAVVSCSLGLRAAERNPRNYGQTAYTTDGDVSSPGHSSCRVGLVATSTNSIRFNQFVRFDSTNSRTFSITIE